MATGTISERRKKVMDYLLKVMNILDPSGQNAKNYEALFEDMSDQEFDKYMRKFFNDDSQNFYLEIVEYERDLTMENIEKAADFMKVPLLERVAYPYLTGDPNNVYS